MNFDLRFDVWMNFTGFNCAAAIVFNQPFIEWQLKFMERIELLLWR